MPLLSIVGITALFTTFNAGFVLLKEENVISYKWGLEAFKAVTGVSPAVIATDRELALMNAIESVFPGSKNVLCSWHINKNILARCKPCFHNQNESKWDNFLEQWNGIAFSETSSEFEEKWNAFETSDYPADAIQYLRSSWLPYKEKFGRPFTKHLFHLGTGAIFLLTP
jgi:histone-lysine N-methyltransferase SETD2